MSIKAQGAKYDFGLKWFRTLPLNSDRSEPAPDNIVGGIGPFDFSAEPDTTQVPMKIKADNASTTTVLVDVSSATGAGGAGVADEAAVTVDELVLSINAATTEVTASKDTNDRVKLVWSGVSPASPTDLQVWDRVIIIADFAQGYDLGMVYINCDTMETFDDTPNYKESEEITQTDADGTDIEIQTDSYRKGAGGTIVDTAMDKRLKAMVEGGVLTETSAGSGLYVYEAPTVNSPNIYFRIETYHAKYCKGTSFEGDIIGYEKTLYRICRGTLGDKTRARDWAKGNYNWTATSFKDSCTSTLPDMVETELTVTEYEALDLAGRDYEAA